MQHLLDRGHDHVDVECNQQAQCQPRHGADHADHGTLHHEDTHDAFGARAQGAQNRDVGALVGHRHHQRGHQIEGRHRHDEREDDEHHSLLDLHRCEPGLVLLRPVADQQIARERVHELHRHFRGLVQIAQLQAHAGRSFQAEELFCVDVVHQHQRRVIFVVAGVERAHHLHLFETRHHTGRSDLARRRNHRDQIAGQHAHRTRQFAAENHAERARHQRLQALHVVGGQVGDLAFEGRIDAAHQRALDVVTAPEQRLGGDKRRRADDVRILARLAQRERHVDQRRAVGREDFDVRDDAEHAVAHLFLKAVHHAEHDDERGHAQRDAQHRHT